MKKRRITHLVVGLETYPVVFAPEHLAAIERHDKTSGALKTSAGYDGLVSFKFGVVLLNPNIRVTENKPLLVLGHEALHLVEYAAATPLGEEPVDRISRAFLTMLVESGIINPDEIEIVGISPEEAGLPSPEECVEILGV